MTRLATKEGKIALFYSSDLILVESTELHSVLLHRSFKSQRHKTIITSIFQFIEFCTTALLSV